LPELVDLEGEAAVRDERVRPDLLDQRLLLDDLALIFDESAKKLEPFPRQRNPRAVTKQDAFGRIELEWPEADHDATFSGLYTTFGTGAGGRLSRSRPPC